MRCIRAVWPTQGINRRLSPAQLQISKGLALQAHLLSFIPTASSLSTVLGCMRAPKPTATPCDMYNRSMALTNTLSISAAGPSIDFRVPDTLAANLVPVAISPSNAPMSPISTPAAAGAGTVAADRPWRSSNNAGMPHSPLVAPAQQLFTTPAAAAGARGIPGAPRQRQQQVQRFAFISPGESVRSELSTDTDMGNGLCAGLNGAGSAGTASRCA